MDYGMIGKLDKAKRYAQQKDRFKFSSFSVSMAGDNNSHVIQYNEGQWHCDCEFFKTRGRCSHTMALEIILEGMLPTQE